MRIWTVPLNELDTDRLISQHRDWHLFARSIRSGTEQGELAAQEYWLALYELHEAIMVETNVRDPNHRCTWWPLENCLGPRPASDVGQRPWVPSRTEINRDRWELLCRWGGSFKGRCIKSVDRAAWDVLLTRYRVGGGCQHESGTNVNGHCVVCKRAELVNHEWVTLEQFR